MKFSKINKIKKITLIILISTFVFSGCNKKNQPVSIGSVEENSFTSEALKFKIVAPEGWEIKIGDVNYIVSVYKPETKLGISIIANKVIEGVGDPQIVLDNIKSQYLNEFVTSTEVEEKIVMGESFIGAILVSSDPVSTTDLHIYAGQNGDVTTAIVLQVSKNDTETPDYMLNFLEKV